jgi:hypothetical protein
MRKSGLIYPFVLLLCWSSLVWLGTYALVETTLRQHVATQYARAQGKIVVSEVGQGAIIRRGVDIVYNYSVNGVEYTGHRYRYDDHNAALEWDATVEEHPRWSSQTVYYNPANPADSLLQPGVDGGDLLLLLFALPLNVMTAAVWRALISQIQDRYRVQPAGGVRILKQPGETRIPLGETTAVGACCYGMAAAAFLASFPIVITGGFHPLVSAMEAWWEIVLAAGVVAFAWRLFRKWSGIYDLRIDQAAQTVTLPQLAGRPQPLAIARGEIAGVSMQRRVSKNPSGTHFTYLPAVWRAGSSGDRRSLPLVTWGWSEQKARAFGQWLSQELGVEFKGVEEEVTEIALKT